MLNSTKWIPDQVRDDVLNRREWRQLHVTPGSTQSTQFVQGFLEAVGV
jgi:hypothetical protein